MKVPFYLMGLLLLYWGCSPSGQSPTLTEEKVSGPALKTWKIQSEKKWLNNKNLINPECILYDPAQKQFYISNGLDYKPGIDGFLSKVSERGEMLELKWVDSLQRPTGMALHDSLLYVADINRLLLIHSYTGKILERYPAPIKNAGLNDVAINEEGEVFVTASFIHAVCKLHQTGLEVWSQEEEKLQWANGILAEERQLLVAGLSLNYIDLDSKNILPNPSDATVQDFDGVVSDGSGGYFLTTVENSGLYHLDQSLHFNKLVDGADYFGDFSFLQTKNQLFIPRGNHSRKEYYISVITLE